MYASLCIFKTSEIIKLPACEIRSVIHFWLQEPCRLHSFIATPHLLKWFFAFLLLKLKYGNHSELKDACKKSLMKNQPSVITEDLVAAIVTKIHEDRRFTIKLYKCNVHKFLISIAQIVTKKLKLQENVFLVGTQTPQRHSVRRKLLTFWTSNIQHWPCSKWLPPFFWQLKHHLGGEALQWWQRSVNGWDHWLLEHTTDFLEVFKTQL